MEYTEEMVNTIKRKKMKKSFGNDTKKILKNRHGLSVLTIIVSQVVGYISFLITGAHI